MWHAALPGQVWGIPTELVEHMLEIRELGGVPVEFVARSHLPLLEFNAQIALMQELAERVAPDR